MINLGDYLGILLSELTIARAQADLEAIRIAEYYANHELLRHFPIPRVRIREVELDIPLVVLRTEDPPDEGSPRGGLFPEVLRDRFLNILQIQLDRYSLRIDDDEREKLIASINDVTDRLVRPEFVQVDTNLAAERYSAAVGKMFERRRLEIGPEKLNSFLDSLRRASRSDFLNARLGIPRVVVGATSAEIREAPTESVVRISLRVTEEGMEWTHITFRDGEDGEVDTRLVPE